MKSSYNIKPQADIIIGDDAREDVGKLSKTVQEIFYKNVISFYQTACAYIKTSMLMGPQTEQEKEKNSFPAIDLWKHAEVGVFL